MPLVAVTAHRMLNQVASLRMAVELLEDQDLDGERRAELSDLVRRKIAALEESLHQLITAPRDAHTQPDPEEPPADEEQPTAHG